MHAVRYHETGGPDVLQVDDVDPPDPGQGEVLVDVHAAGVNPVDTYFRTGAYPVPELPWTPGSDLAGVVGAVGPGVEAFTVGDRVFGTGLGRTVQGSHAEQVVAPVDHVAVLPDDVSFNEGAAVALVGVTAWRALVGYADLEPAETCLVHGASGGVGHVAVQLAEATGARVVATASEQYHDHLRDLGADVVLDYHREDLESAIAEAGAPDVILDTFMDEYFPLDARVAAHGARIVGIGNTSDEARIPLGPAKSKDLDFQVMSMFNVEAYGPILDRLGHLVVAGEVVPEVAETFPLAETADAHRTVMEESFLGKLVVEP
ncbi:NADPH:quinone reductase [Halomarina oriensis]|uniref:Zinc-binding dehydrogenase n=1 Tax=Halomarina oriensis TaxID=671145 RepID=A0A6B0GLM5_9EURY|nr:NADPH:quinone reductase [Halomarina oriensis]MWG35752.1 zinc-binding dehydrogenase [Halomarina oriensis]